MAINHSRIRLYFLILLFQLFPFVAFGNEDAFDKSSPPTDLYWLENNGLVAMDGNDYIIDARAWEYFEESQIRKRRTSLVLLIPTVAAGIAGPLLWVRGQNCSDGYFCGIWESALGAGLMAGAGVGLVVSAATGIRGIRMGEKARENKRLYLPYSISPDVGPSSAAIKFNWVF